AGLPGVDDDMIAVIFQADEGRAVVDLGPAALDRPVVRVLPVQVRRGTAEEIHGQRDQAGKVERHPAARGRLVERLARQRAEILDQEAIAARREDAAADLVARQFLALEDHGLQARVHVALGRRGAGQARADDESVDRPHRSPTWSTWRSVTRANTAQSAASSTTTRSNVRPSRIQRA